MSIDQIQNITTDSVNTSMRTKFNNLNKPSDNKFESHSPNPSCTNVTIESLSDDDSSVVDSDSDIDEIPKSASDFFQNKTVCTTNGGHDRNQGVIVINEANASDSNSNSVTKQPQIGSIAVQNSTDITFGNKTFYQGPVTIKQFLLEKNQWRPTDSGADNGGFDGSNRDISANNEKPNATQINSKKKKLRDKILHGNRAILIAIGITGIAVIVGAIVFTNLYLSTADDADNPGDGDDSRKNIPINSSIENDLKQSAYGSSLRFVSRSEWLAQPPNTDLNNLELPSLRVIIAHTATENCTNQATCTFRVRYIQTFHMESQGWDDIGYNFLVGGDGSVYEGRGWDKEGAHTKGFNKRSICIAFIGTFTKMVPPQRQLTAAKLLIDQGVKLSKLKPDYELFGHRQLMPTESPGVVLYDIIKTWPHWSDRYTPV